MAEARPARVLRQHLERVTADMHQRAVVAARGQRAAIEIVGGKLVALQRDAEGNCAELYTLVRKTSSNGNVISVVN